MANPQPRRRAQNQQNNNPPSQKEEVNQKWKAYEKAKKEYREAVGKQNPSTPSSELFKIARDTFKGSVRVASGVINAGARVGNAFERDLRNHSLEGQIDNAMVNALFNKQKTAQSSGVTRTTAQSGSKRKVVPILYEASPGNWVMLDKSKLANPKRARGR